MINSNAHKSGPRRVKYTPTTTVGRGKSVGTISRTTESTWRDELTTLILGDSLDEYEKWPNPIVIVSDGAYGVLGFDGDTSDHKGMPDWYEQHIAAWSKFATAQTTLWFWNSEIGWAAVHPVLERYGWRYQNANIWNKTVAHIAGNVNTKKFADFLWYLKFVSSTHLKRKLEDFHLKYGCFLSGDEPALATGEQMRRVALPMRLCVNTLIKDIFGIFHLLKCFKKCRNMLTSMEIRMGALIFH